ncbi:hypothetical protein V6N13_146061 [Hibiscus sabdariffa]
MAFPGMQSRVKERKKLTRMKNLSEAKSFCPSIQGLPSFILIVDIFAIGFTIPKALVNTRRAVETGAFGSRKKGSLGYASADSYGDWGPSVQYSLLFDSAADGVSLSLSLSSENVLSGSGEKESLGSDGNASFLSDRFSGADLGD